MKTERPNTDYFNGTIRIIDCTMTADEANSVYIPTTVYIYGKGYNFLTDELSNVLELARNGAYEGEHKNSNQKSSFEGSNSTYNINITESKNFSNDLIKAYNRIYSSDLPRNTVAFDISLWEENNDVSLTKFGKQSLLISLILPDSVSTKNLHVICTDEYDQLEDLAYSVIAKEDKLYLEFNITHTGEYAVYSYNNSEVLSTMGLDDSPDTGDNINPKWFLASGLFALGLALFFIRFKK